MKQTVKCPPAFIFYCTKCENEPGVAQTRVHAKTGYQWFCLNCKAWRKAQPSPRSIGSAK